MFIGLNGVLARLTDTSSGVLINNEHLIVDLLQLLVQIWVWLVRRQQSLLKMLLIKRWHILFFVLRYKRMLFYSFLLRLYGCSTRMTATVISIQIWKLSWQWLSNFSVRWWYRYCNLLVILVFLICNNSGLWLIARSLTRLYRLLLSFGRVIRNSDYFLASSFTLLLGWRLFRYLIKLLIKFDIVRLLLKLGWILRIIHLILISYIIIIVGSMRYGHILKIRRLIGGQI